MISIIGDTDISLAEYACSLFPSAEHVDQSTTKDVIYFSLGDMDTDRFVRLLLDSDEVIYHNKDNEWSSSDLKRKTQEILYMFDSIIHKDKIKNFHRRDFYFTSNPLYRESFNSDILDHPKFQLLINFDEYNYCGLKDYRKSVSSQIWVAGCSYAGSVWLENDDQRYGKILSKYFDVPCSFLNRGGSSIAFAADQIIRSDIQKGDLVVVGLTGIQRYCWFDDAVYQPIFFPAIAAMGFSADKKFFTKMAVSDARVDLAWRHIMQIVSVCEKAGANLVVMLHQDLSMKYHLDPLTRKLTNLECYLDLKHKMESKYHSSLLDDRSFLDRGSDGKHPGPRTHDAWAQLIIEFVENRYKDFNKSSVDQ